MKNEKAKIFMCFALMVLLSLCGVRISQAQEEDSEAPPQQAPAAPAATGPVDISADEQEFATDSVVARGKVKVVYKDSVITAPLATLYKDETGNPNRAVFTGHPRLSQAHSKIDANMLTLELQKQRIVAVGNAHSEVEIPEDQKDSTQIAPKSASPGFPAPPNVLDTPTKQDQSADSDEDSDTKAAQAPAPAENAAKKQEEKNKPPEKIVTDSERQEFDQSTGRFECIGNVKVVNGDMTVRSEKMQVIYSATSNKPETCLFTGHVVASQGKNTTYADNISYSLTTKRLQASGNVKSKVIQERKEASAGIPTAHADLLAAPASAANSKLKASASATSIVAPAEGLNEKPFWVFSDAQDYSRDSGRMSAQGNVKVVNGDMYGCGPAVVLTKKPDGRADKVLFVGRSQITQPGRRWIADEITYVVETKTVTANGNAKAMVMQGTDSQKPRYKTVPTAVPAPLPAVPTPANTRIASPKQQISQHSTDKRSISSSKEAVPK